MAPNHKPRRRWLQFSLRSFLIVIAVVAACLAAKFNHPRITPANIDQMRVINTIASDIWEIDWSPDGRRVVLLGWEGQADIHEAKTLIHYRTLLADRKPIHFAFSPDENVIAYCENSRDCEIYRFDTGETKTIKTVNHQPRMAFSPDGKILGTGGAGTQAHLWDVASGKLLRSLDMGPVVGGLGVVFSPDGTLAAVSHRNSDARLFDVATGNILQTFAKSMTQHVSFDPQGKRLAIAYVDGTVALWDVATGKQLAIRETGGEEAYGVEWSPDGRMLLSSGRKSDLVVWDPRDMTILRRVPALEWVIGAKFTPDGTRLITAGGASGSTLRQSDRKVQIWAVPNWWDGWIGGP